MAYRVRIQDTASEELDEIVRGLASLSKAAAAGLLAEFEAQLLLLQDGAVSYGLSRLPEVARLGYRTALLDGYLFLYYIEGNDLVVAHFFSQRQDYARLLR